MTTKIKVGDLIWAKTKHFPAWPAKVVDHPRGEIKKNFHYVFFYGSEDFGWINHENISSYIKGYDVKRNFRNSDYRKAVKQIAEIFHEYQLKNDYEFIKNLKPQRTLEEEEERRKKIQERLKVRLFPKKAAKKKVTKNRIIKKGKTSPVIEAASGSSSSMSSSSRIMTVNVRDYKQVVPDELIVLIKRFDANRPSLIRDSDEPARGSEEDQPPILLPEQ